MELINKLKDFVLGNNQTDESLNVVTSSGNLTRQELLDALCYHFNKRLNEETTTKGMLFATSFVIYMNAEDYHAREQSFAHTVRESVNVFNDKIRKMMKTRYSDYKPHAEYWLFQFVPLQEGNLVEGMDQTTLAPKEVFILSSIYPISAGGGVTGASSSERMVATVHDSKNSRTMSGWAVNTSALSGLTIEAKDRFRVDFNKFAEVKDEIKSDAPENISRATIKITSSEFLIDDRRERAIYMLNDYLQISGRGGKSTSGGMTVVRIDNERVMNEQITFRYDNTKRQLFMKASGDVKLNEVSFNDNELTDGWAQVPNKSRILINSEIQLEIIEVKK